MFTKQFWQDVLERGIKSAAQGAVTVWGLVQISGKEDAINALQAAGWGALSMGVLSVLTSLASGVLPIGPPNSPSLVPLDPTGKHEGPA